MSMRRDQSGFTISELIVAIVVLLVLLIGASIILRTKDNQAAVYVAEQRTEMSQIMQSLARYYADGKPLPDSINGEFKFIGTQENQVDLCKILVPDYLKDIPLDSLTGAKAFNPEDENEAVDPAKDEQACNAERMLYMSGYAIAKKDNRLVIAVVNTTGQPLLSVIGPKL